MLIGFYKGKPNHNVAVQPCTIRGRVFYIDVKLPVLAIYESIRAVFFRAAAIVEQNANYGSSLKELFGILFAKVTKISFCVVIVFVELFIKSIKLIFGAYHFYDRLFWEIFFVAEMYKLGFTLYKSTFRFRLCSRTGRKSEKK